VFVLVQESLLLVVTWCLAFGGLPERVELVLRSSELPRDPTALMPMMLMLSGTF
jgi:hypothetical protein